MLDHRQVDTHVAVADDLGGSLRHLPEPPCVDPLSFLVTKGARSGFKPVVNYLGCIGALQQPTADNPEDVAHWHMPELRQARIFDMGISLYDFHKKACELVCNLYELPAPPLLSRNNMNETNWLAQAKRYEAFLGKLYTIPASAMPRPVGDRPFPSMFLHTAGPVYSPFGAAVRVTHETMLYSQERFLRKEVRGAPLGFLVCEHAVIEYMMAFALRDDGTAAYEQPMVTYALTHWNQQEGWTRPQTLVPWIVSLMIGYLNSHNTVVHGKFSKREQHDLMKQSKKLPGGPVRPRDYYTLAMHRQTFDLSATRVHKSMESRARKFRVDVRGHESVKVLRGKMPLSPKDEKKLRERGYRIYAETELSDEDRVRLEHRDLAPRAPGEWIAVMHWWRDNFMSPSNPELPYVPAVRKPTEPVLKIGGGAA